MVLEPVGSFKIENETWADEYLQELVAMPEYRSMDEVKMRAQEYIKSETIKLHFINKAQGLLKTYGIRTE